MYNAYLNSNSGIAGHQLKIKKVTADTTLTANDSGSVILVNPTATTEIEEAVQNSDVVVLSLPTPMIDKIPDYSALQSVAKKLGNLITYLIN